MRKILPLLLLIITVSIKAQNNKPINLKWKVSDTLTYKTVMKDIIVEKENQENQKDSTLIEMNNLLKELRGEMSDIKYETDLFPDKNGHIDITMRIKQDKTDAIFSEITKMNNSIVLRGKITPEGELLSNYYKRSQNNLISILFELPSKPIRVGESWNLDVNFISMDQNFVADTFQKKNNIKLEKIIELNGDKIAVIKYDIEEYITGDFSNELLTKFTENSNKKTFMKATHNAIGYFSIHKGCWIKYDGVMEVDTNLAIIAIGGKKRIDFKLSLED